MLFIEYPRCSTCVKAKRFLESEKVQFIDRDIKLNPPTYDELKEFHLKGNVPLRKMFNTSGLLYKSLNLKDRLPKMSDEEQLRLLATDGMLVKRPILIGDDFVFFGFKEEEWKKAIKK